MLSRLMGQDLTFWLCLSPQSVFLGSKSSWGRLLATLNCSLGNWEKQDMLCNTGDVFFNTWAPKIFAVMLQACFLLYVPHLVSSSGSIKFFHPHTFSSHLWFQLTLFWTPTVVLNLSWRAGPETGHNFGWSLFCTRCTDGSIPTCYVLNTSLYIPENGICLAHCTDTVDLCWLCHLPYSPDIF